jgi:N utilization substance protein A
MSREIIEAVRTIEKEKGIEEDTLIHALEDALLAAYKKTPGSSRHASVELDPDSGDFRVYSIELPKDIEERLIEEARERAITELEEQELETGEHSHVLVSDDDLQIDWSDVDPALVRRTDVTPENFGRIAAQTAKQVILQRIREAEREMMYEEYIDRVGEVVTGIVQQAGDRNNVLVDLGKVEALLPRSEQVDGERYEQGSRIKAVITEVRSGTKGPQVILSRRDPELIRTLFELEVPEIADGLVDIKGVAREPGYRSKIAVESHAQGVDPVGACVGPRGSRVRMVVSELRGEKIDIIPWNPEPARFVAKALSPARGDGRRPRRPAGARDRQGGAQRPSGRPPDRLEGRHPVRYRVRASRGGGRLRRRRRRRLHRSLRRDSLDRQALSERRSPRLPVLRRPRPPGACEAGSGGRGARRPDRPTRRPRARGDRGRRRDRRRGRVERGNRRGSG